MRKESRSRGSPGVRFGLTLAMVGLALAACTDKAVGPSGVTRITISPSSPPRLTSLGETLQLTAKAADKSSDPITVTPDWSSSDDQVVTVDQDGLVTAIGNGTAFVHAAVGKVRDSVSITVHQIVELTDKLGGDEQTGAVGSTLPVPIGIALRDSNGVPIAGRELRFEATGGGNAPNATTDEEGRASTTWTLGSEAGTQTLHVKEAATGVPLTSFTATATPLAAAAVELVSGDGQTGYAGFALRNEIVVRVVDPLGNGKDGVRVTFAVTRGNGSVSKTSVTSGADGAASTRWTLGSDLETQELTITAEGLADTLRVTATLDTSATPTPGRTVMLVSDGTASVGDTVSVLLTTSLEGLGTEVWGAILGRITWDPTVFRLLDGIYYVPGDLLEAGVTPTRDMLRFAVSRPRNDRKAGDVLMIELLVLPGASGTHRVELHLDDLVSAKTFDDLRPAVDAVGASVRIVP